MRVQCTAMRRLALLPLALALSAPVTAASATNVCVHADSYGGTIGGRPLVHACVPNVGDSPRTRCFDLVLPLPDGGSVVAWWCVPYPA